MTPTAVLECWQQSVRPGLAELFHVKFMFYTSQSQRFCTANPKGTTVLFPSSFSASYTVISCCTTCWCHSPPVHHACFGKRHTHARTTKSWHLMQDKPLGHPDCLKGKTFVITGTLDSLYRGEAEDYIKRHSGRVTGSVSGKTDFLVVGENSGNSKVNQVKQHACTA